MRSWLAIPLGLALSLAPLASAASLPRPTPEFAVQLPGGKQILLSSYRGEVVLLQFLFTTCPHCQNTAQMITKIYNDEHSRGFQALGVAFNEMAGMLVPDFVKNYQIVFQIGRASCRERV